VIGSIELDICMKMLRNLSRKLGGKFPSTTPIAIEKTLKWRETHDFHVHL